MNSTENRRHFFLLLVFLAAANPLWPQAFSSLFSFAGSNGASPGYMALAQGTDGRLYGTTVSGGANQAGIVFSTDSSGHLTVLYSFCSQASCADGAYPYGGLVLAADLNFYGTTLQGGAGGYGTIFKLTSSGTLSTLYSFTAADGSNPYSGLIQGTNGYLYGTTHYGGANGFGTVFRITPSGDFSTLHSFTALEGTYPYGGLVQALDGNFYGTTSQGGANGYGTVFKMTPGGTFGLFHSFTGLDGAYPYSRLLRASNGALYGTTTQGGVYDFGSVYKVTTSGVFTNLYNFTGFSDGRTPYSGLTAGTDGYLYGATAQGADGGGTIFRVSFDGALSTLYRFCGEASCADGAVPYGELFQSTDGAFYGTTYQGGATGGGSIFAWSQGIGAFVQLFPTTGRVGATMNILGTNLSGTTGVTVKGRAASFQLISSTYVKATVPGGAATGTVVVATPAGSLSSSTPYKVTPVINTFAPAAGAAGTSVTIDGQSFTGASAVTFGGVKATTFSVDTYNRVTALVPAGAKSGKVAVTTLGGTATSTASFTVQ